MKKTLTLLAVIGQGLITAAIAQAVKNCDELIIKHADWKQPASPQWNLAVNSSKGGALYYFGAEHLDEPSHQQFVDIKKQFEAFKPTVVFYEGPNRGIAETDSATIKQFGESGYVRFLAAKSGARVVGLEPPSVELYSYLISKFPQRQVDVYVLTKEAMRLRTRKEATKQQIEDALNKIISGFSKALGDKKLSISSIDDLNTAFIEYYGTAIQWWQAPQEWFDPNKRSSETGGKFTNEINTLSSDYRDIYMYHQLAGQVNKGERVFAVVGRNHVPLQAEALKCAVK